MTRVIGSTIKLVLLLIVAFGGGLAAEWPANAEGPQARLPMFVNSVGLKFLFVPAGGYMSGGEKGGVYFDDKAAKFVKIPKSFWILINDRALAQWISRHGVKTSDASGMSRILNQLGDNQNYRPTSSNEEEYAARVARLIFSPQEYLGSPVIGLAASDWRLIVKTEGAQVKVSRPKIQQTKKDAVKEMEPQADQSKKNATRVVKPSTTNQPKLSADETMIDVNRFLTLGAEYDPTGFPEFPKGETPFRDKKEPLRKVTWIWGEELVSLEGIKIHAVPYKDSRNIVYDEFSVTDKQGRVMPFAWHGDTGTPEFWENDSTVPLYIDIDGDGSPEVKFGQFRQVSKIIDSEYAPKDKRNWILHVKITRDILPGWVKKGLGLH